MRLAKNKAYREGNRCNTKCNSSCTDEFFKNHISFSKMIDSTGACGLFDTREIDVLSSSHCLDVVGLHVFLVLTCEVLYLYRKPSVRQRELQVALACPLNSVYLALTLTSSHSYIPESSVTRQNHASSIR